MKKTMSLMLIMLVMQMFFTQPGFAKTKEEKLAEKVKAGISKLGTGQTAEVKIKLKDGTKIEGYITEADENQFVVMNTKTNQPVAIPYPKVKQVKGNNFSDGIVILIGVGIAIAFVVIFANMLK